MMRQFASDNWSGMCPEAWAALNEANRGHAPSFGSDAWTGRAADAIRQFFETDCEVYFVFNGTAANALALSTLCSSYHSVICHEFAHIETDECGGPEFFSNGTKLLTATGPVGKIDPAAVEHRIRSRSDIHYPKPRVLSLTQPTELGTVYTTSELGALCELARSCGLAVHMDGARFAHAVAHSGDTPRALTADVGVDVLCLGGTKLGMPGGEAVVFFNRALAREFDYRCKQAGQLASKMRFLAAPWAAMLESGAFLRYAAHANAMARQLADTLGALPDINVRYPVEANAVFADMPPLVARSLLARGWHFYRFIGEGGHRFMCSWDTHADDIASLAADIAAHATMEVVR